MLKIKDNINLEKLKDYGFTPETKWNGNRYMPNNEWTLRTNGYMRMWVRKNRFISFNCMNLSMFDILYKMIKDNLIEQTDEKPPKEYYRLTNAELQSKIKELEEENQKLKDRVGDIE